MNDALIIFSLATVVGAVLTALYIFREKKQTAIGLLAGVIVSALIFMYSLNTWNKANLAEDNLIYGLERGVVYETLTYWRVPEASKSSKKIAALIQPFDPKRALNDLEVLSYWLAEKPPKCFLVRDKPKVKHTLVPVACE